MLFDQNGRERFALRWWQYSIEIFGTHTPIFLFQR